MNPFKSLLERRKAGAADEARATLWTTPWSYRTGDGIYVGHNKEVWLYRELPLRPLEWEDPQTRLSTAQPLLQVLSDLGATSKDIGGGVRSLSRNREIHLLAVTWDDAFVPDASASPNLAAYQRDAITFPVPRKALLLGVKLRSELVGNLSTGKGVLDKLKTLAEQAMDEDVPSLEPYAKDIELISSICSRAGASIPSRTALAQLESWYNNGRGTDAVMYEATDCVYVDRADAIEFAAVMSFDQPLLQAPYAQWMLDASTHPEGVNIISVRAALEPGTVARARLRRSQRKVLAQIAEESATGDLDRVENSVAFETAQQLETFFATGAEPLLTDCSIIMGRRSSGADSTYAEYLRNTYQIEMKPLHVRHLAALDETLPCSMKRVNPFLQDISLGMLAYAGVQGFSKLGDANGLVVGLADPDYSVTYLDTFAAPRNNQPPATAVFGDPGSGKTMLLQQLSTQAALAGTRVFFINPKGYDSLSTFAEYIAEQGAPADVVKMSALEEQGGYFDPFRFAPTPQMAAEVAANFILSVLGTRGSGIGFTQEQELDLQSGLKRGALAGARCVGEAMAFVADPAVKRAVAQQMDGSSLFRLGISLTPLDALNDGAGGLTLVEFDRKLELPSPGTSLGDQTREQRIALAAIRLVTRACLEILTANKGGMMILDEAWTFLSSPDSLAAVQAMSREGRSQNLLPIFATQKVGDLIKDGIDLESYLSRVFCMQMTDARDSREALRLCGLEPTEERIQWLAGCGPRRPEGGRPGRPAAAVHRDLDKRHAAISVGPIPPAAFTAFTTNPEDKARRDAARAAEAAAQAGREELVSDDK
jgi:hypothetical protein